MAQYESFVDTTGSEPIIDCDLAVIGFGKGGKTLAMALAKAGKRVVMIEQSAQMYGGTCINIACVPTKAMIYRSEHPEMEATVSADDGAARFAAAATQTQTLTGAMRAKNFGFLDTPDSACVITGRAEFSGRHTLRVAAGADALTVNAKTIVINTGAVPVIPASIAGLAQSSHTLTSTDLLALKQRPESLVVLGGSFIGVEMASMMAHFGCRVTLVHRDDRLVESEEPEISEMVKQLLTDAGVDVRLQTQVQAVRDDVRGVVVTMTDKVGATSGVKADNVLAALGRRPNTDGLNLAAAGIATAPNGAVKVDEHCRALDAEGQPVEGVFAVGDCNGGPQFTYISLDDYRVVLDQLTGTGKRTTTDRVAVPHCVFTIPPLARVGLTRAEAEATGRPLKTAQRLVVDMAIVPRAKIVGDARGMMTAVVDAETDEILGVTMLSHDSHETINTVAVAMRAGMTASQLRDGIYIHPSMTEALNDLFANLQPS